MKRRNIAQALVASIAGAPLRSGRAEVQTPAAAGFPQTQAESIASVAPVDLQYPPGNVIRYGINSNPGTTSMAAAFMAAFAQQSHGGGAPVYIPTGLYLVDDQISGTAQRGFRVFGDGPGLSVIVMGANAGLFSITSGRSSSNQIMLEKFSINTGPVVSAAIAIEIVGNGVQPSVTVRDVVAVSSCSIVLQLTNCGECHFDNIFIDAQHNGGQTGIKIVGKGSGADNGAATVHKFFNVRAYNCSTFVNVQSDNAPGIEGLEFYGCGAVGVVNGVTYTNSKGSAYFPVQLTWIGGHINHSSRAFNLEILAQITIQGGLFYNSGSGESILLTTCSDVNILGNQFENIGSGNASAITMVSASMITGGSIEDNIYNGGPGSGSFLNLDSRNITDLSVLQNQRRKGTATINMLDGTLPTSTMIFDGNTPDTQDLFDDSLTFASTLSLVGIRADYLALGAPAGKVTLITLTPRLRDNGKNILTIECASANATIAHSTAFNGFRLPNAANYTFPSHGARISFRYAAGGQWHCIGAPG